MITDAHVYSLLRGEQIKAEDASGSFATPICFLRKLSQKEVQVPVSIEEGSILKLLAIETSRTN